MDERTAGYIERNETKYFGKYRGFVADRNDPEQLGRLKLTVPSLLGSATTGWAWPASPYAGQGIGFFFIPQQNDLVWVEFVEGELGSPLWSGGSWAKPNGQHEVPEEARQSYPDQAVIKTKYGHTIVLSDARGSEQIIVRAASGCEIVIDPNANRVTIQAGEIVLRGSAGSTQELATKHFVQDIFDKHTHPSGVGPTGTPLLPSDPTSITSVVKAE
jgi:uncharacterized protein involved in type VI secretion and phage assembly